MSRQDELDKLLEAGAPSTRKIIEGIGLQIPDISDDCLEGVLGEICSGPMKDFPRSWAWPAILAAASTHVPNSNSIRSNIFVALVGPIGAGKSSVINVANYLLDVGDSLFDDYVGSAEGLAKHLPAEFGAQHKLWYVDELGHLLDKAKIEGASFVRVLNTSFYRDEQSLIVAKGARCKFNCKLSIIGGIVDEDFEDAFSAITAHGMYDRFVYGYCPTAFRYDYRPTNDYGEPMGDFDRNTHPVDFINRDVWEFKKQWMKDNPGLNREFEIAMRCALICAQYDGRKELNASMLGPSLAFASEQGKIRKILKPNVGKNQSGEVSQKVLDYLKRYAPDGDWIRMREIMRGTHVDRYGMDLVNRVINALSMCGEIELAEDKESYKKPRIMRLCS